MTGRREAHRYSDWRPATARRTIKLSPAARSLWGKSDHGLNRAWMPLFVHMIDSSQVAGRLWDEWAAKSVRKSIAFSLGASDARARAVLVFLAAVHDIGKATPSFQAQPCSWSYTGDGSSLAWIPEQEGLRCTRASCETSPKHTVAGQAILEKGLQSHCNVSLRSARSLASIVGCHHGTPPSSENVDKARTCRPISMGFDDERWLAVQDELLTLSLALAGLAADDLCKVLSNGIPAPAASLLTGLLIMCDWIASDSDAFPLFELESFDYVPIGDSSEEGRLEDPSLIADKGNGLNLGGFELRAQWGWGYIDLLPSWHEAPLSHEDILGIYEHRFSLPEGAKPRPIQLAALEVAEKIEEPALMILEAPMGEGKTEAALAVAEVFAAKAGSGGVCIALPTMATTDAMFARAHQWLDRLPRDGANVPKSVCLAHGKARLNEEYEGIIRASRYRAGDMNADGDDPYSSAVEVCDWMLGGKRGMLSSFVVCTVDQVLMGALQMKHLPLRHLALASKTLIIDECHAYDAYMRRYLCNVLEWLGSWRVPVILLSATLPASQRDAMARSYLKGWGSKVQNAALPRRRALRASEGAASALAPNVEPDSSAYPLLTYTRGQCIEHVPVLGTGQASRVEASLLADDPDSLAKFLRGALAQGGCAGIVCDTVSRAQETAKALADAFGLENVTLTHARFADLDRMRNEQLLRGMLGPKATLENGKRPKRHVVVGTQVLEQSLDIDFDLLITDVAPVDLLFQRMGRCHRHVRAKRPVGLEAPRCIIRGIEDWEGGAPHFAKGVASVYEEANLLEALAVCGLHGKDERTTLSLPQDISRLVQLAYGPEASSAVPEAWSARYLQAADHRLKTAEEKRHRAEHCLLKASSEMIKNQMCLTDWYRLSRSHLDDKDSGPRAVRDTQETVEVMLLRLVDGGVRLLPWIGDAPHGVEPGAEVPTDAVPEPAVAKVAVQSTVRLPLSICAQSRIELLVEALEEMDANYVGFWQESYWLRGRLALLLGDGEGGMNARIDLGEEGIWTVAYSRVNGLVASKQ